MKLPSVLRSALIEQFGWVYVSYLARKADASNGRPLEPQLRAADAPDHVLVVVLDACRPDVDIDLPLEFTTAIAPAPWTFPSVTSLHTGLYPHEHGAVFSSHRDRRDDLALPNQYPKRPILTAMVEAAGYETYGGFGFFVPFRTARGWYQTHDLGRWTPAEALVSSYRGWREGRDRTFGYLHFQDLHAPLDPPAAYAERYDVADPDPAVRRVDKSRSDFDDAEFREHRDRRTRLYRASVDYLTDAVRPLVEAVSEDTLVVLTADHGESHWEHVAVDKRFDHGEQPKFGYAHSGTPFDMVARVPLAVHSPDGQVSTPTDGGWPSLCDVPATVLEAVTTTSFPEGHPWQTPIPDDRTALCEGGRFGEERKAAYRGRYKVIRGMHSGTTMTAEVDREAGGESFGDIPPSVRRELLAALPEATASGSDPPAEPSRFVQDQLDHLGYQ